MEKIECTEIKEYDNCVKKFFDFKNLRVMIGTNYKDHDGIHKHDLCDQIIFVISGKLQISVGQDKQVISENEFMNIPAREWHKVEAVTKETKILVIKIINYNTDVRKILKEDYIRR